MHAKIRFFSSIPFHITSNRSVSIRLIGTVSPDGLVVVMRGSINTLLLASVGVEMISRLSNTLVVAGWDELLAVTGTTLAVGALVVVGSATAHAEHPEEATADAECGC